MTRCSFAVRVFGHLAMGSALFGALPLAASEPENSVKEATTFAFTLENDVFAGTDRQYTNGTRVLWDFVDASSFSDLDALPDWAARLTQFAIFNDSRELARGASIELGQNIYTPTDTESAELILDDRPYAGWSYLSLNLRASNEKNQFTLGLTLGIVGPASLAEEVQTWVHDSIDSEEPKGWDNQLGNELGLVASLRWDQSLWRARPSQSGWNLEVSETHGASLGNVYSLAYCGGEIRLGYNLESSLSSPRINPANTGGLPTGQGDLRFDGATGNFGAHIAFGGDGKYVARNLFIEGNTFKDSHGVEKEDWVGDLYCGVSVVLKQWTVSYIYTRRSREFVLQEEAQRFGALTLARTF